MLFRSLRRQARAGRLNTLTAYTHSPSTGAQDTIYAYNGRGLQTIVTYEETGDVTMAYDSVGNMSKRTDEKSVTPWTSWNPPSTMIMIR